MPRLGWLALGALASSGVAICTLGCSKDLACASGTVERDGTCVVATPILNSCEAGSDAFVMDGLCVPAKLPPLFCGKDTMYDPASHTCQAACVTGPSGCKMRCTDSPNKVCVTGTVQDFVTESPVSDAMEEQKLIVRLYNATTYIQTPTMDPLATAIVESGGCFIADEIPSSGLSLMVITVDDAPSTMRDDYALMGVGLILQPGKNSSGVVAYKLNQADLASWQTQIGAGAPTCAQGAGLGLCGMWIGHFFTTDRMSVTNVAPTRPGDEPLPTEIYSFGDSRAVLTPADTSSSLGLVVIAPDRVEARGGVCATGGCLCGNMPCTPTFTSRLGGTLPGLVFYQEYLAN
jgi:hypothetical protein